MRPFADDGGNGGGGLPWLSGPLLITAAVALLVLLLIATLIVWRVYRRIRRSHAWDRGVAAIRAPQTRAPSLTTSRSTLRRWMPTWPASRPTPTRQRSALDALGPQIAQLVQTSYLARQTMLQTELTDRERRLTALSEQIEQQAAALKIYRQGAHDLDIGDQHA